jgi:hypothetical protein
LCCFCLCFGISEFPRIPAKHLIEDLDITLTIGYQLRADPHPDIKQSHVLIRAELWPLRADDHCRHDTHQLFGEEHDPDSLDLGVVSHD